MNKHHPRYMSEMQMPFTLPSLPGRLGDQLVAIKKITQDHLHVALQEQRLSGGMIGTILVKLGFLTECDLADVIAARADLPRLDRDALLPETDALSLIPISICKQHQFIPLQIHEGVLQVAMTDPFNVVAKDALRHNLPPDTTTAISITTPSALREAFERLTELDTSFDNLLREVEGGDVATIPTTDWQHPVVRFVNALLADAVRRGASDIHLEPESRLVCLRYRIDGALEEIRTLHPASWPEISYRLKIMAGMNIADTRRMQDGRFSLDIGVTKIDFRMSTMPMMQGENIVIRVLDSRRALLPLSQLGYSPHVLSSLEDQMQRPDGIVLVTGPTGCGKTTTLYALLQNIRERQGHLNIMTLEEPVEYSFDALRQTQINVATGLDFASGVRGVLRQDPDVVFIGEIRDPDTAHMALRSAMTGHRVFSTLHCRDALGALPRLMDMGLTSASLSGHLSAIVAQRLVRKLCPQCKTPRKLTQEENEILSATNITIPDHVYDATGCASCRFTGIKGRVAVAEILRVTRQIDDLITSNAPRSDLLTVATESGFRSMQYDGLNKLVLGEVSLASLQQAVDMTGSQ